MIKRSCALLVAMTAACGSSGPPTLETSVGSKLLDQPSFRYRDDRDCGGRPPEVSLQYLETPDTIRFETLRLPQRAGEPLELRLAHTSTAYTVTVGPESVRVDLDPLPDVATLEEDDMVGISGTYTILQPVELRQVLPTGDEGPRRVTLPVQSFDFDEQGTFRRPRCLD